MGSIKKKFNNYTAIGFWNRFDLKRWDYLGYGLFYEQKARH